MLDGLDVTVARGKFVALLGASSTGTAPHGVHARLAHRRDGLPKAAATRSPAVDDALREGRISVDPTVDLPRPRRIGGQPLDQRRGRLPAELGVHRESAGSSG